MPSVSPKQHRFMEMVAHNPAAASRVGVPQSVGRDYVSADKIAAPKPASAVKLASVIGKMPRV